MFICSVIYIFLFVCVLYKCIACVLYFLCCMKLSFFSFLFPAFCNALYKCVYVVCMLYDVLYFLCCITCSCCMCVVKKVNVLYWYVVSLYLFPRCVLVLYFRVVFLCYILCVIFSHCILCLWNFCILFSC